MVSQQNRPANLSSIDEAHIATLGKAFWRLVHHYQMTQAEQAQLLGIKLNRQRLKEYRDSEEIPHDPDKAYRVAQLVSIHKNLRILFPHNREIVYGWLHQKREMFDGLSALEFIGAGPDSIARLFTVRRRLDQIRCGQ